MPWTRLIPDVRDINYLVCDLETSIKNRDGKGKPLIGNNKASPHWPDNNIVMPGVKKKDTPVYIGLPKDHDSIDVFVAHNLKFDLTYLMLRETGWREWFIKGGSIWCTQLAEYIISGQSNLYPKLEDCSVKYGGTVKDDRVKAFWDEGIDTEDIPTDMLREYLVADVDNTEIVFINQVKESKKLGCYNLILSQMEALRASVEMEYHGMYFAREAALKEADVLLVEMEQLEKDLEEMMAPRFGVATPNCGSDNHIGTYLFGGNVKYDYTETILDEEGNPAKYKSGIKAGQPKTRKAKGELPIKGHHKGKEEWRNKKGWKCDKDVLKEIDTEFTRKLLQWRTVSKDIRTYYIGLSELVWPDGFLHGNIHHCSTATGRLSSSTPNMQNISGD